MKKITNEEKEKIVFAGRFFGKKVNPIKTEISLLEVGENLLVSEEEWQEAGRKSSIAVLIGSGFRDGRKFTCNSLSDKSGWVVTRIK